MSIENAAPAAPFAVRLADGKEYEFSPFTLLDWRDYSRWINAREGKTENAPRRIEEVMATVEDLESMLWIVTRSISKTHPKMAKVDQVAPLVGGIAELAKLLPRIIALGEPEADAGNG